MPVHEDSIAAIESAEPVWQAAALVVEYEGHEGDSDQRQRHQLAQIRSLPRQLAHRAVDVLHSIKECAHQLSAILLDARQDLYATESCALRDVVQEIVGFKRTRLVKLSLKSL